METLQSRIKYNEQGLVPAVVQSAGDGTVLMVAWMNAESVKMTLETGETWFWSRSRQELWHKGATSGNRQKVVSMGVDCDGDTLLVQVQEKGPACHTGSRSCFENGLREPDILKRLYERVVERRDSGEEGSYTVYLFNKGVDKILKKVGEEASEVIIAAKNSNQEELIYETADLIYHMTVLLAQQGVSLDAVKAELQKRYDK